MTTEERIAKQKAIVEEFGRVFDKDGFQPIAGRILGLLMVMDKEQFTFDEIVEELNISKSSASNMLRSLEIRGSIEYITIPGDRKKYYQIKRPNAFEMFSEFEKKIRKMRRLFESIIDLKADKQSENSKYFREMIKMTDLYIEMLEMVKVRFGEENI